MNACVYVLYKYLLSNSFFPSARHGAGSEVILAEGGNKRRKEEREEGKSKFLSRVIEHNRAG